MDYPIRTLHQLRPLLKGLRKQAGVSQAGLAAQLGISQQSYAKIEANPTATSFERLFSIVRILGGELVLSDLDGNPSPQPHSAPAKAAATSASATPPTLTPPNKESW